MRRGCPGAGGGELELERAPIGEAGERIGQRIVHGAAQCEAQPIELGLQLIDQSREPIVLVLQPLASGCGCGSGGGGKAMRDGILGRVATPHRSGSPLVRDATKCRSLPPLRPARRSIAASLDSPDCRLGSSLRTAPRSRSVMQQSFAIGGRDRRDNAAETARSRPRSPANSRRPPTRGALIWISCRPPRVAAMGQPPPGVSPVASLSLFTWRKRAMCSLSSSPALLGLAAAWRKMARWTSVESSVPFGHHCRPQAFEHQALARREAAAVIGRSPRRQDRATLASPAVE